MVETMQPNAFQPGGTGIGSSWLVDRADWDCGWVDCED